MITLETNASGFGMQTAWYISNGISPWSSIDQLTKILGGMVVTLVLVLYGTIKLLFYLVVGPNTGFQRTGGYGGTDLMATRQIIMANNHYLEQALGEHLQGTFIAGGGAGGQ